MGKGSVRRPEAVKGSVDANWDKVFGKRKKAQPRPCNICGRDTTNDDSWYFSTYKGAVCSREYGCGGLTPDERFWISLDEWARKKGPDKVPLATAPREG